MTSPNQARPPVKRALVPPPPPPATATLTHVHSTRTSNEVPFTMPGSRSEPDVAHINTSAVPQPFLDPALLQEHQDNDTKTGTS